MSKLTPIIERLTSVDYEGKRQLLEFLLRVLYEAKDKPESGEREAMLTYAYGEIDVFMKDIMDAKTYKEKDLLFECADMLLRLIMLLCPNSSEIPAPTLGKVQVLVRLMSSERYLETALEQMFAGETVTKEQTGNLLSLAEKTEDEFQKGKLYGGFVYFHEGISKMDPEAKSMISSYLTMEFRRYLGQSGLTEDQRNNLELMADVCRYFASPEVLSCLRDVMKLGYSNINYYGAGTLLSLGEKVPEGVVTALARDLEYADLTYKLLCKHDQKELFPGELTSPEYLAKSDMVHWLTYPTELGKQPDEIEYVGKVTYLFKKDVYYVFKYRSDSDTLGDEVKNRWLIGWSNEDGGTFSNFALYEQYEGKTVKATLRNIKRKLIG